MSSFNKVTVLVSTADETGAAIEVDLSRMQKICQISITGTQIVALQGRVSDDHDWVEIGNSSVDTIFLFTSTPQLRAVTTGTSGGSSRTTVVW